MNYTLMSLSSLKYKGLIQTAITLWNQHDIRALIAFNFPLHLDERIEKWQEIEDKVTEKVQQLLLPKTLKEEILSFIKPIGLQILKWMEYHQYFLDFDLPDELCWTPQGTVDQKKTAEVCIKNKNFDIKRRYRLACIYCLEEDIKELWTEMTENCREYFYSKEARKFRQQQFRQQELVVLWTYDINGEVAKIDNMIERLSRRKCSLYQYAFNCAAGGGNKVATEYFLQKLTPEERKKSLRFTVGRAFSLPKEYYAGVLCFLLSQMDEGQQTIVFQSNSYDVLECFLNWPWQDFFMETANRMWNFLSKESFYEILWWSIVFIKVSMGYKDYNYQKLFREFWQGSPTALKGFVIDKCVRGTGVLLSQLFEIEDKEYIKLILKDATAMQREKIICSNYGLYKSLIYNHKWDLLQFFVQECISSKNLMIKFKESITRRYSKEELEKDMWKRFFQILDDLILGPDKKRCVEEVDSKPAKRLDCSSKFEAM